MYQKKPPRKKKKVEFLSRIISYSNTNGVAIKYF